LATLLPSQVDVPAGVVEDICPRRARCPGVDAIGDVPVDVVAVLGERVRVAVPITDVQARVVRAADRRAEEVSVAVVLPRLDDESGSTGSGPGSEVGG
jgi:hypothetical protein